MHPGLRPVATRPALRFPRFPGLFDVPPGFVESACLSLERRGWVAVEVRDSVVRDCDRATRLGCNAGVIDVCCMGLRSLGGEGLGARWSHLESEPTSSCAVRCELPHGFVTRSARAGMSVEHVQHVFDVTYNRPLANRGWFAYWRNGAQLSTTSAARVLSIPATA